MESRGGRFLRAAAVPLTRPRAGRPVVLGDTSYSVPFERESAARAFAALCTDKAAAAEIARRVVTGKRPITKTLLNSIDWRTLAAGDKPQV